MEILILGGALVLAAGVMFAIRAGRSKRRQFDERSDATKLVSSAGARRRDTRTKERFMGDGE